MDDVSEVSHMLSVHWMLLPQWLPHSWGRKNAFSVAECSELFTLPHSLKIVEINSQNSTEIACLTAKSRDHPLQVLLELGLVDYLRLPPHFPSPHPPLHWQWAATGWPRSAYFDLPLAWKFLYACSQTPGIVHRVLWKNVQTGNLL